MSTSPLRARLDRATGTELKKLTDVLKLKPLTGGAAPQSRIEVAYFDAFDRARPKTAVGSLSYGAALAAVSLVMTPPMKAEIVSGLKSLGDWVTQLYVASSTPGACPAPEPEEFLATGERVFLDRVGELIASGKKPGEDPVRAGLKIGGAAALPAIIPTLGWIAFPLNLLKASWDADALDRLIRATILTAAIGERLRLETQAMTDS